MSARVHGAGWRSLAQRAVSGEPRSGTPAPLDPESVRILAASHPGTKASRR